MPTNHTDGREVVRCWIDDQGIVWSHDCRGWATPAVAVTVADYNEVRSTMLGIQSYHAKDTETPFCRVCGASDGRWPCAAYNDAGSVLALIPEIPQ